jgi:Ca2+:H+ antiporter
LLAVVLLAKKFSLVVDVVTAMIGAPPAFAGVLVALPDSAPGGGHRHRGCAQQRSAEEHQPRARIVAGDHRADHSSGRRRHLRVDKELVLGLNSQGMVLLLLTFFLSMLTFGTGRNQHPVRAGAYGGVCRVRVHGIRAVIGEE